MIHSGGARRTSVDFLEENNVSAGVPNYRGDSLQIVHSTGILACVDVVDENGDEQITSTGARSCTRDGARDEETERARALAQS